MFQRQLSLIHQFKTTTRQLYHGRFGLVPNHLRAELSQVQNRNAPKVIKQRYCSKGRSRCASTAMAESPCRGWWYHQPFLLQRDPRGPKMVLMDKAISADFSRVPHGSSANFEHDNRLPGPARRNMDGSTHSSPKSAWQE